MEQGQPDMKLTDAWVAVANLAKLCERNFQQAAETVDMSYAQATLLLTLHPGETQSMKCLSGKLGCDASNTTGLVTRLAEKGFVERQTCPTDKRMFHVLLTPKGESCRAFLLQMKQTPDCVSLNAVPAEKLILMGSIAQEILDAHQPPEQNTVVLPPADQPTLIAPAV